MFIGNQWSSFWHFWKPARISKSQRKKSLRTGLGNSKKKEEEKKGQKMWGPPNIGLGFEHLKKLLQVIVPLIIDYSLMRYLLLLSELPVQGWHGVDSLASWLNSDMIFCPLVLHELMPKAKRQIRFDLIFVMVDFVGEESTHLQKWGTGCTPVQ